MLVFVNDSKRYVIDCPNCKGTGEIHDPFYSSLLTGLPPWNKQNLKPFKCSRCKGTGKLYGLIL
ncbi:hypothetical protein JXI42_03175 [bacterium]|nr:hypothetical protein [bacterium]